MVLVIQIERVPVAEVVPLALWRAARDNEQTARVVCVGCDDKRSYPHERIEAYRSHFILYIATHMFCHSWCFFFLNKYFFCMLMVFFSSWSLVYHFHKFVSVAFDVQKLVLRPRRNITEEK